LAVSEAKPICGEPGYQFCWNDEDRPKFGVACQEIRPETLPCAGNVASGLIACFAA